MTHELPPLPDPDMCHEKARDDTTWEWSYSAEALQEYARLAVKAERERLAAKWEHQHGFDKYGVAAAIRKGE